MLTKELQDAINDQIQREFYSSYLYLSMAAYFESTNLPGAATWMRVQSQEEWGHGMRLFDYLTDRGARVILAAIGQPPTEFAGPLDAFEKALAHEQEVTASIHRLYGLAVQHNDYPTQVQLQWFVQEQVEEEKTASAIVEQLKVVASHPPALLMLDRELGARGSGAKDATETT